MTVFDVKDLHDVLRNHVTAKGVEALDIVKAEIDHCLKKGVRTEKLAMYGDVMLRISLRPYGQLTPWDMRILYITIKGISHAGCEFRTAA